MVGFLIHRRSMLSVNKYDVTKYKRMPVVFFYTSTRFSFFLFCFLDS